MNNNLVKPQEQSQIINTKSQMGGRTKKTQRITRKKGRGAYMKGWSNQGPGYHERTIMMKNCGKKCFLGPRKTFPICTKNTCTRNKKGIYAAYVRAREYSSIRGTSKYRKISTSAKKLLHSRSI
jgi:hypothetical protein